MSGTDGTDAAHREPHWDVGCGLSTSCRPAAARSSFLLRNDPGFPPAVSPMSRLRGRRCVASSARARGAPALVLPTPGGRGAGHVHVNLLFWWSGVLSMRGRYPLKPAEVR